MAATTIRTMFEVWQSARIDTAGCCHKAHVHCQQSVIRLGNHEGPLRTAVLRMKKAGRGIIGRKHGTTIRGIPEGAVTGGTGALVVPIPLHWRRFWSRGYNQAAAVAEQLARRASVPCAGNCSVGCDTPHNSYNHQPPRGGECSWGPGRSAEGKVDGNAILLVDDVMTTGSTASEVPRVLLAAGAVEITVAILARR